MCFLDDFFHTVPGNIPYANSFSLLGISIRDTELKQQSKLLYSLLPHCKVNPQHQSQTIMSTNIGDISLWPPSSIYTNAEIIVQECEYLEISSSEQKPPLLLWVRLKLDYVSL
jgi:hypothetical protein